MDATELKDDLVQDMISVLTSFCARLYDRRAARLCHVAGTRWGSKRYLNMELIRQQELNQSCELEDAI
jgi:hypothetical protein